MMGAVYIQYIGCAYIYGKRGYASQRGGWKMLSGGGEGWKRMKHEVKWLHEVQRRCAIARIWETHPFFRWHISRDHHHPQLQYNKIYNVDLYIYKMFRYYVHYLYSDFCSICIVTVAIGHYRKEEGEGSIYSQVRIFLGIRESLPGYECTWEHDGEGAVHTCTLGHLEATVKRALTSTRTFTNTHTHITERTKERCTD